MGEEKDKKPQRSIKTYDDWPSTTDKPFQPMFNGEDRRWAAAIAGATLSAGPNALSALTGYVGARAAAGTPQQQAADLSGVVKGNPLPENMAEVLKALLGPGRKNKGVVLGDSNHLNEGINEALADPQVISALKQLGVTHVILEWTPKHLQRFREPRQLLNDHTDLINKHPLSDYFSYCHRPMARIVQFCDAAGINVVPMDIMGPATQHYFDTAKKIIGETNRERKEILLREHENAGEDLFAEQIRITSQVWVPRIQEAMKSMPKGKFLVLAGDGHINNPLCLGKPDVLHADLDEQLAAAFREPVPYIRVVQKDIPRMRIANPRRLELEGYGHKDMDTPEFIVEVPSRQRQEVGRLHSVKGKEVTTSQRIEQQLERYDEHLKQFVGAHANVLQMLKRAPSKEDFAAVDALLAARQLVLTGQTDRVSNAIKPARGVMEALDLASSKHPHAARVQAAIREMRETLDRMQGHETSPKAKDTSPSREPRPPWPTPPSITKPKDEAARNRA